MEQQQQHTSSHPPMPFLEVTCRSSGQVRRFAAGTNARYALHTINRKLKPGAPMALHVEAVKEGEEPVSFGPTALLANYGEDWKLQTINEQDYQEAQGMHHTPFPEMKEYGLHSVQSPFDRAALASALMYTAKIILAFIFIFFLGALFTFFLEKLPDIIAFATSLTSSSSSI